MGFHISEIFSSKLFLNTLLNQRIPANAQRQGFPPESGNTLWAI